MNIRSNVIDLAITRFWGEVPSGDMLRFFERVGWAVNNNNYWQATPTLRSFQGTLNVNGQALGPCDEALDDFLATFRHKAIDPICGRPEDQWSRRGWASRLAYSLMILTIEQCAVRTTQEVDLHEHGVVVLPSYKATSRLTDLRSSIEDYLFAEVAQDPATFRVRREGEIPSSAELFEKPWVPVCGDLMNDLCVKCETNEIGEIERCDVEMDCDRDIEGGDILHCDEKLYDRIVFGTKPKVSSKPLFKMLKAHQKRLRKKMLARVRRRVA